MLRRLLEALFGYKPRFTAKDEAPESAAPLFHDEPSTSVPVSAGEEATPASTPLPVEPSLPFARIDTAANGDEVYHKAERVYVDKHGTDGFGVCELGGSRLYFKGPDVTLDFPWNHVQQLRLEDCDLIVLRTDRKNPLRFRYSDATNATSAYGIACALQQYSHARREWNAIAAAHYGYDQEYDRPSRTYIAVVGESFRQEALKALLRIRPDRVFTAVIKCEPTNAYDPNAVMVCHEDGAHLGYLERRMASEWCHFTASHGELRCPAELHGGTRDKPSVGVVLDFTDLVAARKSARANQVKNADSST